MINLYGEKLDDVFFGVAVEGENIFATNFSPNLQSCLSGMLKCLPFNVPFTHTEEPSSFAQEAISVLKDVYDGKDISSSFHLAVEHLTVHTQKVISATRLVPLGYATSYAAIAKSVGGGPRSVGHVMADNPFPPLVPCHRVVGSDLSLRGYGGGLDVKLALLKRESRGYNSEKDVSVHGRKLRVFPVEFVLKKLAKP
jgi:O-6-methylguanine DNA methyltransferase